jgi:hypothetical protein
MTFRPKLKNKIAHNIVLFSLLACALLFVAAKQLNQIQWLFQMVILVLAVLAIQVLLKYILSDYIYELRDTNFLIYKIQGKKSVCLCSLSLTQSMCPVMTRDEFRKRSETLPKHHVSLNYCKNIAPKDEFLYMFDFNGKITLLLFEPDEIFVKHMNNIAEQFIQNRNEE